jgi:hypothetical protein
MAARKKSGGRKYGKAAGKSVKRAMHKEKRGTLKSGRGGKGGTVTSRKQAIAIGLSEAREAGAKVPRKKTGKKGGKKGAKRGAKKGGKKGGRKKSAGKRASRKSSR